MCNTNSSNIIGCILKIPYRLLVQRKELAYLLPLDDNKILLSTYWRFINTVKEFIQSGGFSDVFLHFFGSTTLF
ncbi:MAG: hypothetical protein ACTHJ2_03990 [Candidatus Nitrosocosmicus sp.]